MAREVTISKAVTKLVLDATDLEAGAVASRQELRYVNRALRDLSTPMERYERDLEKAGALLKFGADGQELYNRAIEKAEKKLKDATGETEKAYNAEKRLNDDRKQAQRIIERNLTPMEKYEQSQQVLNRLFRQGLIDAKNYRRELDRLGDQIDDVDDSVDDLGGGQGGNAQGEIAGRFGLQGIIGNGATALSGQLFLLEQVMRLSDAFYASLRRAGEFAVNRFNQDRLQIDETIKAARALDIDVQSLTGLQFAFGQASGLTDDQTIKAIRELTKRTSEAAQGFGETKLAFREVGLSAQELNRLAPEERIIRIAEALEGLDNQSDRFRLAGRFFGEEQANIILGLADGSEGLIRALEKAEKLGLAFSVEEGQRVEKMNDAIDRVFRLAAASSRRATIEVSDEVLQVVGTIENMFEMFYENEDALQAMIDFVETNILAVGLLVNMTTGAFSVLTNELGKFGRRYQAIANATGRGSGRALDFAVNGPEESGVDPAFGTGATGDTDPLDSINQSSREAFNVEFRTELNNQMQLEHEQLLALVDSNQHQLQMVASLRQLQENLTITDLA